MMPRDRLTPKEIQVATLVWEGLTNREISKIMGTTEQVIKNHLREHFRQAGGLEPAGVGNVYCQPRREGIGQQESEPSAAASSSTRVPRRGRVRGGRAALQVANFVPASLLPAAAVRKRFALGRYPA